MAMEIWAPEVQKRRRLAIQRLLKACKESRRPASITLIKRQLAEWEAQG